jgi:hypothetical protein
MAPRFHQGHAQRMPRLKISRIESNAFLVLGYRRIEIAERDIAGRFFENLGSSDFL